MSGLVEISEDVFLVGTIRNVRLGESQYDGHPIKDEAFSIAH